MQISPRPLQIFSRVAAVAVFAGAATLGLHAQQATPAARSIFNVAPQTDQSLIASNEAPATIGYSTSAGAEETADAVGYIANPSPQPPPRRYGRRPVYADSSHNADGSSKYTFAVGGGFTVPTGGTHNYYVTGWDFQGGVGRNFNKKLALLLQFDWDRFGLQQRTVDAQQAIYGPFGITSTSGNGHIWSFTLDPMYTFVQGEKTGAYVIGGVGFYHKVTDFTTPAVGTYCDYYYGCYQYQSNQTFDSYVSNAAGVNGGVGFTYRLSRFSDLKFYGEARYVYTANQAKPFYDGTGTNPTSNAGYFNVFPQNSAKTTYIPVTFGIRF